MAYTPFTAGRRELWASGQAFPVIRTAAGREAAACIASLEDSEIRTVMDPLSKLNGDIAFRFQAGRQAIADLARAALYCKGLLDELVFPDL